MADKKFTGTAYISLNGRRIGTVPGSGKLSPGGVVRTPLMIDGGLAGYTEKPQHAEIECEIAMSGDVDIMEINKATSMTLMFETDSGQAYVVRNGAVMEPLKHEAEKTAAKFFGAPAEPV
jgi:hydrogenase maturation factor